MERYEGQYDKLEAGLKKQYKDKAPDIQVKGTILIIQCRTFKFYQKALYDKWKEEKKEELDILEQAANWDGLTDQQICIQIEKKRRKLDLSKCTKVTPETFKIWREKKSAEVGNQMHCRIQSIPFSQDAKLKEAREQEEAAKMQKSGKRVFH